MESHATPKTSTANTPTVNTADTHTADTTRTPADTDYVGHSVVDEHDHEVGTVIDVAYDDGAANAGSAGERPAWLVVDPGLFRAEHWVPVAGTYRSASGSIVVPWDWELIKHSPKADDGHLMTPQLARELERHYEVSTLK